MKFRFPYVAEPVPLAKKPRPSRPPNQTDDWRALVEVTLSNYQRAVPLSRVLVDSGAVETVFVIDVAHHLGIHLTSDPSWKIKWRGSSYLVEYGDVDLELCDADGARLQWRTTVGFTAAFSQANIRYDGFLGYYGCLRSFDARYRGEMLDLALEPNGYFQGNQIGP